MKHFVPLAREDFAARGAEVAARVLSEVGPLHLAAVKPAVTDDASA